jgi:serine/threonine protein kinase
MSLSPGTRLGPYEIESAIGAGGMGEVYKARDTRLDRTVAVKVLPHEFADKPDLRERFDREARAISKLSHSGICALHDVGHEEGLDFLVMEYLEGETLADRLTKGKLSTEQTLRIGLEITGALEHAHKSGVVHRDLKPGNIMLAPSGVKLLDFGLAKMAAAGSADAKGLSGVLTVAATDTPLTAEGSIVGTLHYMAPEQLEGGEADERTDVFALGTVLYEMATGKKAFEGKSQASIIAAILEHEPEPMSTLEPMTPPALERLVKSCLTKSPDERVQTVHDMGLQLKWITEGGSEVGVPVPLAKRRKNRERIWMTAAVILAIAMAPLINLAVRQAREERRPLRLSLVQPSSAPYERLWYPALSPDGSRLAFIGVTREGTSALWVRSMESGQAVELGGTEEAVQPFWSPDSKNIAFFAREKLLRISAAGGPPQEICQVEYPAGGTWNNDDVILFALEESDGVLRVSANGGVPELVTKYESPHVAHWWPVFLADNHHFVFLADANQQENHALMIGSLDSPESKSLGLAISNFHFVPPDLLLLVRSGTLVAQRIDARGEQLVGDAIPIGEQLPASPLHYHSFTASHTGMLVYRSASPLTRLVWYDRRGREIGRIGEEGRIAQVELSPDGRRAILGAVNTAGRETDLVMADLGREILTPLILHSGSKRGPIWSPDGEQILFSASWSGLWYVYAGSTLRREDPVMLPDSLLGIPLNCSVDGRFLLMEMYDDVGGLYAEPLTPGQEAIPIAVGQYPLGAEFSPDGRWVAYSTNETGTFQVYLQSFPPSTRRIQVSIDSGIRPRWRGDGRELFYLSADTHLMSVDISGGGKAFVSQPEEVFSLPEGIEAFDVTPDGERFLVVARLENQASAPLTVGLNWTEELEGR